MNHWKTESLISFPSYSKVMNSVNQHKRCLSLLSITDSIFDSTYLANQASDNSWYNCHFEKQYRI